MQRYAVSAPLLSAALVFSACAPPPSGARVATSDQEVFTTRDLVVEITEPATTARSDAQITYAYNWYVDGALVSDLTEDTVPADRTTKGQEWQAVVVPNDGAKDGPSSDVTMTVINSLPEVEISVSSNEPISTEDVRVDAEVFDADGDTVELSYVWYRDGKVVEALQGTELLADYTLRDEVWRVEVRGHDGEELGFPDYADMRIMNAPPVITSLTIGPSTAYTLDALTAEVEAMDPDGDPIELEYRWFIDGIERPSASGPVLAADRTLRDQTIEVEVIAYDDVSESAPVRSEAITILNTPPTAPGIGITPDRPTDDKAIVCNIDSRPSDPDGDEFVYTFAWTRNGTEWTGATAMTNFEGDTIVSANTAVEDVWVCTVTANDGADDSPPATAEVTVVLWSGTRVFTPCGAEGHEGPTEDACDGEYEGTTLEFDEWSVSEGYQTWTVPITGSYRLTAYGAAGGNASTSTSVSEGATISGVFDLTKGEQLQIVIGQMGTTGGRSWGGGGGGGTWVMTDSDDPLLIAAGGAGNRSSARDSCDGRSSQSAGRSSQSSYNSSCPEKGYDIGYGGRRGSSSSWAGGGGGGYRSDGDFYYYHLGGRSWFNGLIGGGTSSRDAYGGFGGGGGGDGSSWGGGGGGGYSGGDAGYIGGGGGSYNAGSEPDDEAGGNDEDGYLEVEYLDE